MPWSDFSAGAAWRNSLWLDKPTSAWRDFMVEPHPLFMLPGVSVHIVVPDQLHIADLGVFGRLLANVAFTAIYDGLEAGATLQARMDAFWTRSDHRRVPAWDTLFPSRTYFAWNECNRFSEILDLNAWAKSPQA